LQNTGFQKRARKGYRLSWKNVNPTGKMENRRFHKILVANRGEIALRIIKAIKKAGIKAVAIYSEADREMPYVKLAEESWPLGNGTLAETYLNQQLIIDVAIRSGASAIHPGYGFLAENADFANLCRSNQITFIGPSPEVIDLMGNKSNARATAKKFKVPVIEGITGNTSEILKKADHLHYPVLIKPSAGGGGKGMRIVRNKAELKESMEDAAREAKNYFGSPELYIERFIEKARHIEVQVLSDNHGNAVHLFERECTLQRRYQKIIEEAPAASISEKTREKITNSAVNLIRGINYCNAGTIEFLVDENEEFFFIEMNTRIQVEHPVTEMITGIDLIREQINIASGSKLSMQQSDIKINGHAIEARLYAEDPGNEFMPVTGTIRKINTDHVNIRMDNGYNEGNSISPFYDPMISKIVSHGTDRKEATRQLISGLKNYHISGVTTNRDFLVALLQSKHFAENTIHTRFIDNNLETLLKQLDEDKHSINPKVILSILSVIALKHDFKIKPDPTIWEEIGHWRQIPSIELNFNNQLHRITYRTIIPGHSFQIQIETDLVMAEILDHTGNFYKLQIDQDQYQCWADVDGPDILLNVEQYNFRSQRTDIPDDRHKGSVVNTANTSDAREVFAPLNGKVVKINVNENETVKSGDTLLVIESMKMENRIISPRDADVEQINVSVGDLVELNELLITLK
jgi:3-methylcrotonyl-CoA carboxylase alpha subunit